MVFTDPAYKECKRLIDMARTHDSQYFFEICKSAFSNEPIIRKDAIISLGVLRDSRSYFVLASLFKGADIFEDPIEIRKNVIYAFGENLDLRGRELLELSAKNTSGYQNIAKRVLKKLGKRSMIYTYLGTEENLQEGKTQKGMILIPENLSLLERHIQGRNVHPQTYIVDKSQRLILGIDLEEHVQVASGNQILAAGEIRFSYDSGILGITELNNRSNSYFPHESSIKFVKQKLKQVGLKVSNDVIQTFPREGWLEEDWLQVHITTIFQLLGPEYLHYSQELFSQK
jgi:hypothetical protein